MQLTHPAEGRRAALVYENELHLLATYRSVYSFALAALDTGWKLRDLLSTDLSGIVLNYDEVYSLDTPWRFLPSFDHPEEPGRCLLSRSGPNHAWHYVGCGTSLAGYNEPLHVSPLESAAPVGLAALYVIGHDGAPRRVGVTPAIDLPRAGGGASRSCAIGPELVLDAGFPRVDGSARVTRSGREIWSQELSGGDAPLSIALAAIEPDHFECAGQRRPGDIHVHFFGDRLFGSPERAVVKENDEVEIEFNGFGRALRNRIAVEEPAFHRLKAAPL